MVDPLSVAGSAAGLVSLGLQSTEYLYNFYAAVKNQHHELTDIAEHLRRVLDTLRQIDDLIRSRTWRPNEASIKQNIEESLARNEDVIHALQDETEKFQKEPTDSWKKRAIVIGRQAAYPFKRSTLGSLKDNVCELRDSLSFALQSLQLKEHQNTQKDIESLNTAIQSVQALAVSDSLRQWLKAPDARVDLNAAYAKRHVGTGEWLVGDTTYTTWLQQENSFLWLYGFAGCGKSVLCSTAIKEAFRHRQSSTDSAVAFFFFTFTDNLKQDASAALRALLLQLCGQISGLEAGLIRLKESCNQGTPAVADLLTHLRQAVTRCRHVYILLDALDECSMDGARVEVLTVIETIREWELPGLHLLVTSRDMPDIRAHLPTPSLSAGVEHVALKNESVNQDIAHFVSFTVDHDPQLQRWGDHRETIKDHLVRRAGGVFRWVEHQLQPLRHCARSQKLLKKYLNTLPETLDETYERILCSIETGTREEAQHLLGLLCYAPRPLSVSEVIEALAVDIDDLECYDPASRLLGGADDLLRLCPGLIEINPSNGANIREVRIAHFSVQEYLTSERIRSGAAACFALTEPLQHGRISKTCLLYLEHDEFLQQELTLALLERYAFATYSAQYWHYHYRRADSEHTQLLSEELATSITTHSKRERWIQLHDPETNESYVGAYDAGEDEPEGPPHVPSAIFYTSLLGLDDVLMKILAVSAVDVSDLSSGLYMASLCGHERVMQLLLGKGADPDIQSGRLGTALHAATLHGRKRAVQILLDAGVGTNNEGVEGAALYMASSCGFEEIVQMLISKGANINIEGARYRTPLWVASFYGHEKVVQMLLDQGADVNKENGSFGTALQAASSRSEKVVQMLLSAGAEVNIPSKFYSSPLREASWRGYENIVRMLLDAGADVNIQDGSHSAPLQGASSGGYENIVRMLLDVGADVNEHSGFYGSPLREASCGGHENIVRMLLDAGAIVNIQDGSHSSALQAASWEGHENIVRMLLDSGADVNIQDGFVGSALQWASEEGYENIVRMLLDSGADVNIQDGFVGSALQRASDEGHENIVRMLLGAGAIVNTRGIYGTPLEMASRGGYENIVRMLLDAGADVNARGFYGTPLEMASRGGYENIARMLLDAGANDRYDIRRLLPSRGRPRSCSDTDHELSSTSSSE